MKTRYALSAAALALVLSAGSALAADLSLEPCINGSVSATGTYATQAEEDKALGGESRYALEPCINGAVSASGTHVTQAAEDAARAEAFASTFAEDADQSVR
jgi:hypothetical protein